MRPFIKVTDCETGEVEFYDFSPNNWRGKHACMRNGLVYMWAPKGVMFGRIKTSGRYWELTNSKESTE